jgi:membrane-bound acyltransferase YfiQ involved in biofilm formation
MSLLFYAPKKLIAKSEHAERTTSSIILISVSIFVGIIILMYAGLMYTETAMKQYSDCRNKIIGYEQSGFYTNSDQFKLALSYCDVR